MKLQPTVRSKKASQKEESSQKYTKKPGLIYATIAM